MFFENIIIDYNLYNFVSRYTYIKCKKHYEGISHHQRLIKFDDKVVQLQKVAESVEKYA
jgi:hypothetical protein